MATLSFQADPSASTNIYDLLPKGKYLAMVIASELKPNSKGTGEYLQLTFEVIEGPRRGRKIFDRLNIRNANSVAEKIAKESLNGLCLATGAMHLTDSDQLHNIPVQVSVDIELGRDGYDDQNRIKGYSRAGGVLAQGQAMSPVATQRAISTPAGNIPVWKKRAVAA